MKYQIIPFVVAQALSGHIIKYFCALAVVIGALVPVYSQNVRSHDDEALIVARITVRTDAERLNAMRLGLDLMEYRDGDDLIFLTTPKQLGELRSTGWTVRLDEQMTTELPVPGSQMTFMGGYRTVEETHAFINQMAANHPNLAQVFTYGQSWLKARNPANGYDLVGITLTNRNTRGSKPTFFLQAGIHARELAPPEMATRFIQYLLTNYGTDADATWLLDEHKIVVIPIVNPDGRKIAEQALLKRKNMNNLTGGCSTVDSGIDLNRNYAFSWGVVNMPTEPPCGGTFPGLSASSEPEILSNQALLTSIFPDQRLPPRTSPAPLDATGVFLDMHSTGNLVLYPWGQDSMPAPNPQLVTIANKMAGYNGYNPIQSVELYPTSGTSKDFAYGELGVAGFTMETGLGSGTCGGFMPAYTCLDGGTNGNFWNLNRPVLLYLAKIARTPYMTAEGPTTETLTAMPWRMRQYNLRAQVSDEHNGEQNISAVEAYVNSPPWRGGVPVPMTAEDGSFNSPIEFAVGRIEVKSGRHMIYVRSRDTSGNWGAVKAVFVDEPARGSN